MMACKDNTTRQSHVAEKHETIRQSTPKKPSTPAMAGRHDRRPTGEAAVSTTGTSPVPVEIAPKDTEAQEEEAAFDTQQTREGSRALEPTTLQTETYARWKRHSCDRSSRSARHLGHASKCSGYEARASTWYPVKHGVGSAGKARPRYCKRQETKEQDRGTGVDHGRNSPTGAAAEPAGAPEGR